jgi:hypothetical protein
VIMSGPRATLLLATMTLVACAGPSADPVHRVRGPIAARILQPAALIFPSPRPARASLPSSGERRALVDLQYSSIFEQNATLEGAARFDGEVGRLAANLLLGLGEGAALALEPSLIFASSGFLDAAVDAFHALTGLPGGGRESAPRDQYAMSLERGGSTAWSLEEDELLLGDLPLTAMMTVLDEGADQPGIAARFTLELPTGSESRGSGSGGWDTAAGVVLEKSSGRWTFTGHLDGVQVDTPRGFLDARLEVDFLLFAGTGVEYRWSDETSLLLQLQYRSPLTDDLPLEEVDGEILDVGVGVAHDLTRESALTISFHEDAVAASGPDFTLYFGLTFGF